MMNPEPLPRRSPLRPRHFDVHDRRTDFIGGMNDGLGIGVEQSSVLRRRSGRPRGRLALLRGPRGFFAPARKIKFCFVHNNLLGQLKQSVRIPRVVK